MKVRLLAILVLFALLLSGIVPVHSAQAASCTWHVVKRGENLTMIARYHGVSVSAIVRANNIKNPSLIYRNQRLCIPKESAPPPPSGQTCTKVHVVKRGEYLKIIANRYGTTVAAIVKANGIKNANRIYVGQRLKIPVACPKPQPPKPQPPKPQPPKPPASTPWRGLYWTNRDLAGSPKFVRNVARIDMNWGNGGPPDLGVVDNFSIRWARTQYFPGGRYFFHVRSKDSVRLLVDGQMVIDEWHDNGHPTSYTAEGNLSRGNHRLQVDYYNHTGPAEVQLQIEPIGGVVPPDPVPGDWSARYWNNKRLQGDPVWTTSYRDIVFDWGRGSPKPGVSADFFSARYVGDFHFSDGKWRFYATVDDGVRIWLDDTLIMDEWRMQSRTTFYSDVDIPEGTHRVKIEFFENTGAALLKVLWSKR